MTVCQTSSDLSRKKAARNDFYHGLLEHAFLKKVIPLLQEYFYDDWEKIQIVFADLEPDGDVDGRRVRENAIIKRRDLAGDTYLVSMVDQDMMAKSLYIVPDSLRPDSIIKIYEG